MCSACGLKELLLMRALAEVTGGACGGGLYFVYLEVKWKRTK